MRSMLRVVAGPFLVALLACSVANAAPLDGVRAVVVAADGGHVYAASEFADAVVVFTRSSTTGELAALQTIASSPDGPRLDAVNAVALSPDGRHLYAAAFGASAVNVFAVDPISGLLSFVDARVDGEDGVDGLRSAHGTVVSPDGSHVYVAGFEDGAIAVFARDADSGALSFVEVQRDGENDVDGLAGVLQLAVSPDGAHLYAAAAGDDAVAVFARDAGSGALTFRQVLRNGDGATAGLRGARTTRVSPDGRHVYVGSGGLPGSVADHAIAAFARDSETGLLGFAGAWFDDVDGVAGLAGVYDLAFAAGGASLYAASFGDNAVSVFDREADDGLLAFRQVLHDGAARLGAAHALAVSDDDRHVYVAAFAAGVQTLVRDATGNVARGPFAASGADGCPTEPPPACRQAERATLVVRRGAARPGLRFAWRHGAATTRAELGDPVAGATRYALCAWDGPVLVVAGIPSTDAVPRPGWRAVREGFRWNDPLSGDDELRTLAVRPGADRKAGLRATMAGALTTQPLDGVLTVVVQHDGGVCWSATLRGTR